MARVSAAEWEEKFSRRLKAAGPDIRAGIERTTEAPGIKAAAKADKMLAGIQEAISSGLWQQRVAGVSLQEWKDKAINKGIGRIAAGVDASKQKNIAMAGRLLAAVDESVAAIDQMPDNTFEDRLGRMVAFSREMHGKQIKE